jgi:hypothetical protein
MTTALYAPPRRILGTGGDDASMIVLHALEQLSTETADPVERRRYDDALEVMRHSGNPPWTVMRNGHRKTIPEMLLTPQPETALSPLSLAKLLLRCLRWRLDRP